MEDADYVKGDYAAQLYGQEFGGAPAVLIAGREALVAIRDAINDGLRQGRGEAELEDSHGDSFCLVVRLVGPEKKSLPAEVFQRLPRQFTNTRLRDRDPEAWALVADAAAPRPR